MPPADSREEITTLLASWRGGDRSAFDRLFTLLYGELRGLARGQARRSGGALSTTTVVHEAYLKLHQGADVKDRSHFFALAARVMRQVVVDRARQREAHKRGGTAISVTFDENEVATPSSPVDILAVDMALRRLEALDERLARLVELRCFTGLSVEESAAALDISPRTAKRDWQKARALLSEALGDAVSRDHTQEDLPRRS